MKLFYNPIWFPCYDHLTLFLAKVPDPTKIKTYDDLEPHLAREIEELVVRHKASKPAAGKTPNLPDLIRQHMDHPVYQAGVPPSDGQIAGMILDLPLYRLEIHQLWIRPDQGRYGTLSSLPKDQVQAHYQQRSLESVLELVLGDNFL